MTALGLTDHHSLSGAVEFQDACQQAGIQADPGIGSGNSLPQEMGTVEPGHLILLAMDMAGWRSLCRISSSLAEDNDVLPFDRLANETRWIDCA